MPDSDGRLSAQWWGTLEAPRYETAPATKTTATELAPQTIEEIARVTAERVASEVSEQLARSLSILEKEARRARKAADLAACAAGAIDPRRTSGKGKKDKKKKS